MPKVSVIIPNYNHELFLRQRIQSILDQTYQDFEIIYLDDASTDNSNQVFSKFAEHPRIRAIYNQTNSGSPFKQWNKGILHAQGEYIWIAESDDYADKTLLARLVEKLDQNPSVGLAYCQSWRIDKNNNTLSTFQDWTDDLDAQRWQEDFINSGLDECKNYLIIKNTIPNASAVLFRRSLHEKVGGADETFKICGDWLFWVKILLISDIAFIAEPLNYFRTHDNTCRVKATREGFGLNECIRVINFIAASVEIPPDFLMRLCLGILIDWSIDLINIGSSLETQFYFYKNILHLINLNKDPKLKIFLYKNFIKTIIRVIRYKLGLRTRLKNIWSYFPYRNY